MGDVALPLRRILIVASTGLALTLLPAGPAGADPPNPTDYRSEVLALDPPTDGVRASVVGGDGFLLLEVEPGRTVAVPGYDADEEYVRFLGDGRVQENRASVAYAINQSRQVPDDSPAPGAEPRWTTVATDGRWAWHDHRIHNMRSEIPPAARTDDGLAWDVPIVVDGTPVVISGRYRLLESPSPLPWLVLALVLAGGVVLAGRRLSPLMAGGLAVLLAAAGAIGAGVAQRGASPPGAATSALVVVLPTVAAVAGIIVVMQRSRVLRAVAALAGAAALGGWALVRLAVLWSAVLPTDLAFALDRAATALALGAAVGSAVVVVRSGALAPPPPGAPQPAAAPVGDPSPT